MVNDEEVMVHELTKKLLAAQSCDQRSQTKTK